MRVNTLLKPGDLCNMPHRVAAALQAAGWYWRSTIVWAKKSPMPESLSGWRWRRCRVKVGRKPVDWSKVPKGWDVGEGAHDQVAGGNYRKAGEREKLVAVYDDCPGCDKCQHNGGYVLRRGKWRPTTAHEYLFMLTKSARYFCDGDAVAEAVTGGTHHRGSKLSPPKEIENHAAGNGHAGFVRMTGDLVETRNPRSVWTLSSEPFKGLHFATFPTQLVKRCIEAATSAVGCCPQCGSCYAPVVESERVPTRPGLNAKIDQVKCDLGMQPGRDDPVTMMNLDPERHVAVNRTIGHRPTCECQAGDPQPCTVFDPFAGSGTTLQTARVLGRHYLGCEISEKYAKLAEVRLNTVPKWAQTRSSRPKVKSAAGQAELFQ
jgi:hypothetical protein